MPLERESNNSLNSANAIGGISTRTKMMRGSISGRASGLRLTISDLEDVKSRKTTQLQLALRRLGFRIHVD